MSSELTFDEARHEYRVRGVIVPSVTQVLAPLSSFDGVPAHVLEAKRDLGQRVHLACQLHDEDDLDEASVETDVAPYLDAYRRFLADTDARVVLNESRVYHPTYRYAGTLDRVFRIGEDHWLVDLKTCFTTPRAAGPQTAAYLAALTTMLGNVRPTRRAALRLRPDGTYRLDPLDRPDDWSAFVACLTLNRFKEATSG